MAIVETIDLDSLRLTSGEGRRLELETVIGPFELGGEPYPVEPSPLQVALDISRTTGQGYSLRLRFKATLSGPCMRCLAPTAPEFTVDAREISQPDSGDELDSPYVEDGALDLAGWARDALALTVPASVVCKPDCLGLCPDCGIDLNTAPEDHHHDAAPDARWAKLSELKFD